MKTVRAAAAGLAIAFLGSAAAFAAETCCCCKDGAKMECCEKMKGASQDGKPQPKPGEQPAAPHQHQH